MSAHMLLAIREIFAGAKFRGIACQPLRRNFRGFDFCACTIATVHVTVCTVQTFVVLILAAANLSAKNAKFCTMQKFPAMRYHMEIQYNNYIRCFQIFVLQDNFVVCIYMHLSYIILYTL